MDTLPNQAIWIDQSMPMIGIASEEEYEVALAKRPSRSYLKWNTQF